MLFRYLHCSFRKRGQNQHKYTSLPDYPRATVMASRNSQGQNLSDSQVAIACFKEISLLWFLPHLEMGPRWNKLEIQRQFTGSRENMKSSIKHKEQLNRNKLDILSTRKSWAFRVYQHFGQNHPERARQLISPTKRKTKTGDWLSPNHYVLSAYNT